MTITDQLVGEIARLSRMCRLQEEVILKLAQISKDALDELAQHRAIDEENRIMKELEEQGWISNQL